MERAPSSPRTPETQERINKLVAEKEFVSKVGWNFSDGVLGKEYVGFVGPDGETLTSSEVESALINELRQICVEGGLLGPGMTFENFLGWHLQSIKSDPGFIKSKVAELEQRIDDLMFS